MHACKHISTHIGMHANTHTQSHSISHMHTCIHAHTHMHACTHACKHTHTHTHTYKPSTWRTEPPQWQQHQWWERWSKEWLSSLGTHCPCALVAAGWWHRHHRSHWPHHFGTWCCGCRNHLRSNRNKYHEQVGAGHTAASHSTPAHSSNIPFWQTGTPLQWCSSRTHSTSSVLSWWMLACRSQCWSATHTPWCLGHISCQTFHTDSCQWTPVPRGLWS